MSFDRSVYILLHSLLRSFDANLLFFGMKAFNVVISGMQLTIA